MDTVEFGLLLLLLVQEDELADNVTRGPGDVGRTLDSLMYEYMGS
jgi:hypothetical protein